jgi:hypothetical protein
MSKLKNKKDHIKIFLLAAILFLFLGTALTFLKAIPFLGVFGDSCLFNTPGIDFSTGVKFFAISYFFALKKLLEQVYFLRSVCRIVTLRVQIPAQLRNQLNTLEVRACIKLRHRQAPIFSVYLPPSLKIFQHR